MNDNIEIPVKVKAIILEALHSHDKWKYYFNRLQEYRVRRNQNGIQKMTAILDKLEHDALQNYIESMKVERTTVNDLMKDMTPEDREYLLTRMHAIVFACDLVDTFIVDVNSMVCKYFPDSNVDFYNKLNDLDEEIKEQIKVLIGNTKENNKKRYWKYSDKIISMVLPYIRAFVSQQHRLKEKEERKQQHSGK